jgi:hypothetical protein
VYNLNYTPTTLGGGGGTKLKRNYIWGYANEKMEYHWPRECKRALSGRPEYPERVSHGAYSLRHLTFGPSLPLDLICLNIHTVRFLVSAVSPNGIFGEFLKLIARVYTHAPPPPDMCGKPERAAHLHILCLQRRGGGNGGLV